MTAKERIKEMFNAGNDLSIKEIVDHLTISKQMAHIVINVLLEEKYLEKLGRTPKTIYRRLADKKNYRTEEKQFEFTPEDSMYLQKEFLGVTESGNLLEGPDAFIYWCSQRKLPVAKTLKEYLETKNRYKRFYEADGIANGLDKIKNTKGYDDIWLDGLYYLDFYAIERFGKTRLGNLLHYAKQGQNKYLMRIMMDGVNDRIKRFVTAQQPDAIGFVPPTIRREVQIMKFIQNQLNLPLPVAGIKKISGIIPVPQKSLTKLEERIRNAENTFAINDARKFDHILLIDDAVGSGSTLNEIAGKLKSKGTAAKVTGLAIVGSFKGFDVINDI